MDLNRLKGMILIPVLLFVFALAGFAQDVRGVYVYPKNNQTKTQQRNDQNQCYNWAQNEYTSNPSGQEQHSKHKALKGGGIGAGAGAILGGGKGAVIGGAAGALGGRHKHKNEEREASAQSSGDFNRAYASCLRGRGYSVE